MTAAAAAAAGHRSYANRTDARHVSNTEEAVQIGGCSSIRLDRTIEAADVAAADRSRSSAHLIGVVGHLVPAYGSSDLWVLALLRRTKTTTGCAAVCMHFPVMALRWLNCVAGCCKLRYVMADSDGHMDIEGRRDHTECERLCDMGRMTGRRLCMQIHRNMNAAKMVGRPGRIDHRTVGSTWWQ